MSKVAERKPISKRIRFEVFKRDSFRCQYCGATAPEVLLEVDHINPHSKCGDDDIINLITACKDCNRGKGARVLKDHAVLQKQYRQLEDLNERREQLEMLSQWRDGLAGVQEQELAIATKAIAQNNGSCSSQSQINTLINAIKRFTLSAVLDAIDVCSSDFYPTPTRIVSICKCKILDKEKPYIHDIFYIRAIVKNRFGSDHRWNKAEMLKLLVSAYEIGADINKMRELAKRIPTLDELYSVLVDFIKTHQKEKETL